jgi:hypothetical protein
MEASTISVFRLEVWFEVPPGRGRVEWNMVRMQDGFGEVEVSEDIIAVSSPAQKIVGNRQRGAPRQKG